MNTVRTLALAVTLAGTLATAAAAQSAESAMRSNTSGYNFGIFMSASSTETDDAPFPVGEVSVSGPGMGLQVGYGFSQHFSVFARGSLSEVWSDELLDGEHVHLAHVDLGLRYSFGGTTSPLRPFLLGALTGRAGALDGGGPFDIAARGIGFTAGAGMEYFVSPTVSIDGGLLLSFGDFSQTRISQGDWEDDGFGATGRRIEIGLSLHP